MGIDEEYLEDLLKSIEPIINPDGVVDEDTDPNEIPDMPEEELDSNEAEPEEMDFEEETASEETEAAISSAGDSGSTDVSSAVTEIVEEEPVASEVTEGINPIDLLDINPEEGNKILSPEEIEAMFGAVNAATADAKEPDAAAADESEGANTAEGEEMALDAADIDALLTAATEEPVSVVDDEASLDALLAEAGGEIEEVTDDTDALNMSADEIDAMLNAAKDTSGDANNDGDDLMSLLANVGDEDLSDIQSILDSDENGAAVAEAALAATENVEDVASTVLETEKEAKARKKKEKKEAKKQKKQKKGETAPDSGEEAPKKNLFVCILEALTEPVDEEDFGIGDAVIVESDEKINPEEGMSGISDENKEILEELDKEKGKKKGKKKKKDKKGKKGDAPATDEDGEEGAEAPEPKKKKKPKKEKKPKVEKVDEFEKPEKRLPRKKVRATFAFCFTMLAAILIAVFALTKINNLKEARWAFDNQDYQTAYDDLYGVEVKGEDEAIFNKSQIILQIERKYKSYQNYQRLGMSYEAVDSLIEAVKLYPYIRERAVNYGIEGQTDYTYSLIISTLQGMGVSEAEAKEIAMYDSKVRYTKRVKSIADGTPYTYDDEVAAEGLEEQVTVQNNSMDDILPEEADFLPADPNSIFDDNAPVVEDNVETVQETETAVE